MEKIKRKIGINVKENENLEQNKEIAFIRLNNFRPEMNPNDPAVLAKEAKAKQDAQAKAAVDAEKQGDNPDEEPQEEQFQPEKLPLKIPLVKPDNCESGPCIVYHSEAVYMVRKFLIEQARKTFKELDKAETNALLQHSYQRTRMLEERFEDNLIRYNSYGRGSMHIENNYKLVFKTFLQD